MNEQIRISPIRLIGAEGEQHGIVPTAQAQEMAREAGLDLVEVAAQERPPVCKIMDYGKYKYEQSKKTHQKTHQQKLKEIRVRPKTGEHDIDTRVGQAIKFLEHNDKVQVNVLFRGREMQHIEEGKRVMDQVLEALLDHCKVESPPRMEGKRMVALLAPKPGKPGPSKPKPPKPPAEKKDPAKDAAPKPAADATPAPDQPTAAPPADAPAAPAAPKAAPAPVAPKAADKPAAPKAADKPPAPAAPPKPKPVVPAAAGPVPALPKPKPKGPAPAAPATSPAPGKGS